MKIYHHVFEIPAHLVAKWYTIINGEFYYWSVTCYAWVASNNQDVAIREYLKAKAEGRVFRVQLKGRVL